MAIPRNLSNLAPGASTTGVLDVTKGGTGVTTSTGSGNVVLSTSPVLTTPNLGVPSALTLTNATGLPLSTGITGTLGTANGGTGLTSVGTNGQVLQSNGSSLTWATPSAGAVTLISTQTVSGGTLEWSGLTGNNFMLVLSNLFSPSGGTDFALMQIGTTSYTTSSYNYSYPRFGPGITTYGYGNAQAAWTFSYIQTNE